MVIITPMLDQISERLSKRKPFVESVVINGANFKKIEYG